jgi:hypothetical protein
MSWRILGRRVEGETCQIQGVNIWHHHWKALGQDAIRVFDPAYRETFRVWPYGPAGPAATVRFAAGESSASVSMFWRRHVRPDPHGPTNPR